MTTLILTLALLAAPEPSIGAEDYLERYFATFPSRATAAGRHDLDRQLEDLSPKRRADWVAFNRRAAASFKAAFADEALGQDDRLDAELLLRHAELELMSYETLRRPERDPLFWTGLVSNATVFLLVRDDLPLEERLESAAARARRLPRLARQAREALSSTDPSEIAPELCRTASSQVRGSARFYAEGFADAADGAKLHDRLRSAGKKASAALGELADFLDELAGRAVGSPRLGDRYAPLFKLATGIDAPVDALLARAEADLGKKRAEVADYGRGIWDEVFPDSEPPADDRALVARLFDRIAEDRAPSTEAFVEQYKTLVAEATRFVRERGMITLPEPLTVHVDRSPSFFVGQAVGGVYAAGPYAPDADTLLFLPTPPEGLPAEDLAAFFRDFNDHFNRMITPHEIVPGHYLQLKLAARHPRKVRALFADGVYVEGWGTFCERLLLDEGWGGPLERLAHLKKQLENIARTVVDIRVHTRGMTREEVLRYVKVEALQDDRFASNMWARSIRSAPQLTTYYLGFHQVWSLYEDVKAARGEEFELRDFMDGMMEMGPVAVRHYRERMLPSNGRANGPIR